MTAYALHTISRPGQSAGTGHRQSKIATSTRPVAFDIPAVSGTHASWCPAAA